MGSSDSRRGWWITGGVAGAAVLGAGAFVGWQAMERPAIDTVSPPPGAAVASDGPQVSVALRNADRLGDLTVRLDGRDVTHRVRGARDRLLIPAAGLRDGTHRVEVAFRTGNLFARTLSREWEFEVDTRAPRMRVAAPAEGTLSKKRRVTFRGTAEPGARVAVAWKGGDRAGVAGPDGRFALTARLPEGLVATTVSARDRAGNTTQVPGEVMVDTVAPTLTLAQPRSGSTITQTDAPLVRGVIGRDDPGVLVYGATVNGRQAVALPGAAGVRASSGLQEVSATTTALDVRGRRFQLAVGTLPQGLSTVDVWVKDRAGNVAKRRLRLMVDSSEEFGALDMVQGARGEDARALNRRLKQAGVLKGRVGATFGPRTRAALLRYQRSRKLRPTGMLDAKTRESMVGRIVVDLSEFTLRLYRDGRVVKRYRVAVGAPAFPTPTGDFTVVDKQTDPAWFPPDSPWAAGLGPIPPGPGNPLGTRWIGTSAPAIGIHGTYAPSSIGTAASHGCIRMHIRDVEELYEYVSIGMPVRLQA
ncbi:MAG TPA: L,D-transpeptidase family protein [Miltoncostaeaceae bacterium]|nr:L,D-transpeptidase family protein [Miltoncostaeaceae bacterium]